MGQKEYFAFISYKREDEKWASWLQNKLEHFRLPNNMGGKDVLPKYIRPVFKDTSELASGVLVNRIQEALDNSHFLIVICSPSAAKSPWINKEANYFIESGRAERIIPFIIDGSPKSRNLETECFPQALRNLPEEKELIGINIKDMGRNAAAVKVVAHMLDVSFDTLWQREEKEKNRKWHFRFMGLLLCILVAFLVGYNLHRQNQRLLISQSRLISKQVPGIISDGNSLLAKLISSEVLPKNLTAPDRPLTTEAEYALRTAMSNARDICFHDVEISDFCTFPDGERIAIGLDNGGLEIWGGEKADELLVSLAGHSARISSIDVSSDGQLIASCSEDESIRLWDVSTASCSIIKENVINGRIKFSPKGTSLAVYSKKDSLIRFFNTATKQETNSFCITPSSIRPLDYGVLHITFSKDGAYFAAAVSDGSIRVFNISSGLEEKVLFSDGWYSTCLSFSPDGKYITSPNRGGITVVWDWRNNEIVQSWVTEGVAQSISYSPNEKMLMVCTGKTIRFYDTSSILQEANIFREKNVHEVGKCGGYRSACFINNNHLICYNQDFKSLSVKSLFGGTVVFPVEDIETGTLSFSKEGQALRLITREHEYRWSFSSNHEENMSFNAYSANVSGDIILIKDEKGIIVQTVPINAFEHTPEVVNVSPCCYYLVSLSADDFISVYNIRKRKLISSFSLQGLYELWGDFFISICDSGDYILVGKPYSNMSLRVIRTSNGQEVFNYANTYPLSESASCISAVFSPSGETIAIQYFSHFNEFYNCVMILDFPELQKLINDAHILIEKHPLTSSVRQQYYLD